MAENRLVLNPIKTSREDNRPHSMNMKRLNLTNITRDKPESRPDSQISYMQQQMYQGGMSFNSNLIQQYTDPQWEQCKITGANILPRSYSSCVEYNGELYIYGGYEHTKGALDDFWRIRVNNNLFRWESLKQQFDPNHPGPLCRHTAHILKHQMYLFGGLNQSSFGENKLRIYNLTQLTWEDTVQFKTNPPQVDSHCAVLFKDKIIVLFGYQSEKALYSNEVYQIDLLSNKWQTLSPHSNDQYTPPGRVNSSAAILKDNIHIFGGNSNGARMNDHWVFNLQQNQWSRIYFDNEFQIPKIRSGCTMNQYENKLYLFGGIHDITWELDDLYMFDPEKKKWKVVDPDSSRSAERPLSPISPLVKKRGGGFSKKNIQEYEGAMNKSANVNLVNHKDMKNFVNEEFPISPNSRQTHRVQSSINSRHPVRDVMSATTSQKFTFLDTGRGSSSSSHNQTNSFFLIQQNIVRPLSMQRRSSKDPQTNSKSLLDQSESEQNPTYYGDANAEYFDKIPDSPTQHLQQQRRKEFFQNKALMLKEFQLSGPEKEKFRQISPTSEAMKTALFITGNPMTSLKPKPGKLSEFGKTTVSRFLQPLTNKSNTISGKQPCARDGHNSVIYNGQIIIFGGDRHQMSFNDLFALNLELIS